VNVSEARIVGAKVCDGSQPPGATASPLGVPAGGRWLDRHGWRECSRCPRIRKIRGRLYSRTPHHTSRDSGSSTRQRIQPGENWRRCASPWLVGCDHSNVYHPVRRYDPACLVEIWPLMAGELVEAGQGSMWVKTPPSRNSATTSALQRHAK
jgi:hypothetical protein